MATKKKVKKSRNSKKKTAPKRKAKPAAKKARARVSATPKKAVKRKAARKPAARGKADRTELVEYQRRGLGAMTGGQAGDTQGISARLRADSESVEELLEEGQTFEAEAVAGVENALDPDQSEVITHEVPEDDVPEEYREKD